MADMTDTQEKKRGGKGKIFALLAGIGAVIAIFAFWRRRRPADDEDDDD